MSHFSDIENSFSVYEAPKNGGTTLRLWIFFAGTGEVIKSSESAYYTGNSRTHTLLKEWGYHNGYFQNTETEERVCIKRDPVKRFVSCFHDKVMKEGRLQATVDELLDDFERILDQSPSKLNDGKTNFMKFHFDPQTTHFGKDYSYYTHVFDTTEVSTKLKDYLENKWQIELPDLHARNSGSKPKFELTSKQIDKIKEIYSDDYNTGWA